MEQKHAKYQRLLELCRQLPATVAAVAHPCDETSLKGAVEAAELGLVIPTLVGPRKKIEALANQFSIDLSKYQIVDSPHSHAAAETAVQLVREGKAEMLAAAIGGLDALVFTAGIGEHSAAVREQVCKRASWLGVELDPSTNAAGGPRITTTKSRVSAWVIPTDEDLMIARHAVRLLAANKTFSPSMETNVTFV